MRQKNSDVIEQFPIDQKLGSQFFTGVMGDKWIIMQNGDVTTGLIEDMFETTC